MRRAAQLIHAVPASGPDLNNSSLQEHEVDSLLQQLAEQDAVEVTDAGKYRPSAA